MRVLDAAPRIKVEETQTSGNTLKVRIRRLNRTYNDRNIIYAPKFPKPQQESWFVIASDAASQRVLGLQRVTLSARSGGEKSTDLQIPESFKDDSLIVRVLNDGWRGVDVEKVLRWENSEKSD